MKPLVWIKAIFRRFWHKNITNSVITPDFSETRFVINYLPATSDKPPATINK